LHPLDKRRLVTAHVVSSHSETVRKSRKNATQPMLPVGDCYENRSHAA